MNASPVPATPKLKLRLTRFETPMEIDMERFFEFSFDLAEDILDMEVRFAASPNRGSDRITPPLR